MADVNYNMPINVVKSNPTITPFCHECVKPGMFNHLPRPPALDVRVASDLWQTDLVRNTPKPPEKKKRATFTLDDL